MFSNILLDILVVLLAHFLVSSNGEFTEFLVTDFALDSHFESSRNSLQTFGFACISRRRDWDDKTGRKCAVGFVIPEDVALWLADVGEHVEKIHRVSQQVLVLEMKIGA